MADPHREKEIVDRALEESGRDAREAYLREACAGDEALWRRVRAVIEAGERDDDFLPGTPRRPPAHPPLAPGMVLHRYRLLEQIGEGGFGVVYMAEQSEPIRRRVAVKVIKPGMDSRQVIGRFEAERQALALMEHPNIAKVLDAGATEAGRPYFVMELVRGVPITRFCTEQGLDVAARLRLAIEVCAAVQHAHQKGVIHRDLKPSNILVSLHGDRPVPKVIDFGIAKAIEQPLTDQTVFTLFHQLMGTPAYMSPEQLALSGLDVDTRSDIYSLGVLLYELLTGTPPFDTRELLRSGLDTLRRTLLEMDPPRPSTRLSRRDSPSASPDRRADRVRSRGIRGDLDLIVMKALSKDRDRRYATANGLAADLQRYLDHQPVSAAPPTVGYQVRMFYRRHRTLVAAVGGAALLLVMVAVISLILTVRARRAEAEARLQAATAQQVSEFFWKAVFKQLTPWEHTNRAVSLEDAVRRSEAEIPARTSRHPLAEAAVRLIYGRAYFGLGDLEAAEPLLVRALQLRQTHVSPPDERLVETLLALGNLRNFQARYPEAAEVFRQALEIRTRSPAAHTPSVLEAEAWLVMAQVPGLGTTESVAALEDIVRRFRRAGLTNSMLVGLINRLGRQYLEQGDARRALEQFDEGLRISLAESGPESSGVLWSRGLIAETWARSGRLEDADREFRELIATRQRLSGRDHRFSLELRSEHAGRVLTSLGRYPEAAEALLGVLSATSPEHRELIASTRQHLLTTRNQWKAHGGGEGFDALDRAVQDHAPTKDW
ncbi:MAG: serine/threonine protein kinase [Verrucomicrobiae bacterium]|nr:serine/threonine protein kinase [Verrucomicrobiae bacterium]